MDMENALIDELIQGMENAKQLRFHLHTSSPSEARDLVVQEILSSYEKALWILKRSGSTSKVSNSLVSADKSPESEGLNSNFRDRQEQSNDSPKKRKLKPTTWTGQVRVNSENGLEGPTDDAYSWRKYGQKDILGAKYPRSYYRCTYRSLQNCWATKLVQRSDDDPTVFEITYKGTHTCNQSNHSLTTIPVQSSPENQDSQHYCHDNESQQQNHTLLNLEAVNLRVNNEDLDNKEMMPAIFSFPACHDTENCYFPISDLVDDNNHLGTYSPVIYSSTVTSESNYLSAPNYQMNSYGDALNLQNSKSEFAESISAHVSTTNSPTGGMDFQIDPIIDLDPNFPFNTSGYIYIN